MLRRGVRRCRPGAARAQVDAIEEKLERARGLSRKVISGANNNSFPSRCIDDLHASFGVALTVGPPAPEWGGIGEPRHGPDAFQRRVGIRLNTGLLSKKTSTGFVMPCATGAVVSTVTRSTDPGT